MLVTINKYSFTAYEEKYYGTGRGRKTYNNQHSMDETGDSSGISDEECVSMDSYDSGDELSERCDEADPFTYECLTPNAVVASMNLKIREIGEWIPVDPVTLRMLLDRYNWDDAFLKMKFYDFNGDIGKIFDEAKVPDLASNSTKSIQLVPPDSVAKYSCEICNCGMKDIAEGLTCQHNICEMCMELHFVQKTTTAETSEGSQCPVTGCELPVTDKFMMAFTEHQQAMFNHIISSRFVECQSLMTACPEINCLNVIKVNHPGQNPVTCICGKVFCFQCGGAFHEPLPCVYLKYWMEQHGAEFETFVLMRKYVRNCPSCSVIIHNDSEALYTVCNHCGHCFCWKCLRSYTCGEHIPVNHICDNTSRQNNQNAYMCSRNGWVDHKAYLSPDEHNLRDDIRLDKEELGKQGFSESEIATLISAEEELYRCHVLLMYCYISLFYMRKNQHKALFEFQLDELDKVTETLSDLFLSKPDVDKRSETISQVSYVRTYCQNHRRKLLKLIQEGTEIGYWAFQLPESGRRDSSSPHNDDVDPLKTKDIAK